MTNEQLQQELAKLYPDVSPGRLTERLLLDMQAWKQSWYVLDRERTNLKRRLTTLRRGLVGLGGENCLDGIEEHQAAARSDLKRDDAMRRRFEKAEKRRLRKVFAP